MITWWGTSSIFSSTRMGRFIKSRWFRWAGHV